MPFSRANRRLTMLSLTTIVLSIFVAFMYGMNHAEAAKAGLLIFGPVAVIWNNERLASIQRHELAQPMNRVVLNANAAATQAETAAAVTVESFRKLEADLMQIKTGLNGALDERIVRTVTAAVAEQLPGAIELALEHKLEPAIERICQKLKGGEA